jgi:hypothetical protein
MEKYLIIIEHNTPNVVGPFSSEEERNAEAFTIHETIEEDGLIFWFDAEGDFNMGSYIGAFFNKSGDL